MDEAHSLVQRLVGVHEIAGDGKSIAAGVGPQRIPVDSEGPAPARSQWPFREDDPVRPLLVDAARYPGIAARLECEDISADGARQAGMIEDDWRDALISARLGPAEPGHD